MKITYNNQQVAPVSLSTSCMILEKESIKSITSAVLKKL